MSPIQPLTVSKYLTISPSVALKTHCFSSHFIYQNIKYLICFAFIFINKTAAYLMMLIIKAVYTILFACKDIYLLIKPTVYALRFTLDIIELRYVWWFSLLLSRYPKIFTVSFCSCFDSCHVTSGVHFVICNIHVLRKISRWAD